MTKEESKIFGSYSPKVSYTEALSTFERTAEERVRANRERNLDEPVFPETDLQNAVFHDRYSLKSKSTEAEKKNDDKASLANELSTDKPAVQKKMSEKAQEKIESVLTLQSFVIVIFSAICIGLYIYNVISINRLSGEAEELKENLVKAKSLNVELESKIKQAERGERIMTEAYQKLGLRYNINPPVVISRE